LRVFGCLAFIRVPKEKRRKWDSQAIQGIFIGYCSTTKQYRVYDPVTARLHTSRDVVFRENDRYALLQQTESVSKDIAFFEYQNNDEDWSIQRRQMVLPAAEPADSEKRAGPILVEEPEVQPRIARPPRPIIIKPAASAKTERSLLRELKGLKEGFVPGMSLSQESEESGRSHRRTRSEYRREPPGGFSGMIMAAISGPEPRTRTFKEAMSSENYEEWKTTYEKESRCPTAKVSGVLTTADGHPKIKGSEALGKSSGERLEVPMTSDVGCSKIEVSEAPGSLRGGTALGRQLECHSCRARLRGRDPKVKGSEAPAKSSGERHSLPVSPTGYMIAMKQLLRYLAGTVDWKLRIGSHGYGPNDESIYMPYADADYVCWAGGFRECEDWGHVADGLTKALPLPAHREFCKTLGMHGSGL
jgi:hypothetical protein